MQPASRVVSVLLVALLSATAIGTLSAPAARAQAAKGRYIVVLRADVANPAAVAAELGRAHGLAVSHVYEHALKGFAAEVPEQAVAGISRDPRVAFVEADQVVAAFAVPTGVDRAEVDKKLSARDDGSTGVQIDVDIAIIDTGIDHNHADLSVVGGANCTGGGPFFGSCTTGLPGDDNGHGTHVAGTAAARDNGSGVVGVAPGARLHAVKVLRSDGSGYISWIVAGIDWVTARAGTIEVANMSLGCECSSTSLNQAISNSTDQGLVYVVAAGNSAKDAGTFSPANHPEVIAVSAEADFDGEAGGAAPATCRSDVDDTFADFSNYGSVVDLAAPGVCINSTWPGGGFNTISGTSMASPHGAGAAALYVVQNGVGRTGNRWSTVRAGLQSAGWSVPQSDPCGFSGGRSGERFLMLAACDSAAPPPTNTAPTAENVAATTNEDTAAPITLRGSDAETCQLTFSVVSGPSNGSLSGITNNACVSGSPNTDSAGVTYTPNANYNGTDSFTYRVNDGSANSAAATVTITVTAVNDAPTAADDAYDTTQGTPLSVSAPGVLANDGDVDGNPLTAVLVGGPSSGQATLALNADGSFTYTPNADFSGTDTFTYAADDGTAASAPATVTISVAAAPTNTPPVASDDGATTAQDVPVTIAVLGNDTDADGDPLIVASVTQGANGAVTNNGGSVTYTPNPGFYGTDSFSYTASDGTAASNPATVTVTVNQAAPAPPAAPSNLTANPRGRGIRLNWADNSANEDGFRVYRSLDGVTWDAVPYATLPANTTSIRDDGTTAGTTYYYRVTTYNGGGESGPSNVASATEG